MHIPRTNTDHRFGHASMQRDPFEGAPAATTKKTRPAKKASTSNRHALSNAVAAMHRPVHGGFPGGGDIDS